MASMLSSEDFPNQSIVAMCGLGRSHELGSQVMIGTKKKAGPHWEVDWNRPMDRIWWVKNLENSRLSQTDGLRCWNSPVLWMNHDESVKLGAPKWSKTLCRWKTSYVGLQFLKLQWVKGQFEPSYLMVEGSLKNLDEFCWVESESFGRSADHLVDHL